MERLALLTLLCMGVLPAQSYVQAATPQVAVGYMHTVAFKDDGTTIITATVRGKGLISPLGSVAVTGGTNIYFKMAPNLGYEFIDVLVDGISVGARDRYLFLNVTEPHTIEAVFGPTIAAFAGTGGVVSPVGTRVVAAGNSATFAISALPGYDLEDVQVDGFSVGAVTSYTFNDVTAPHTISATFAVASDPTITASVPGGGTISRAGNVAVTRGTNIISILLPMPAMD
ncbi:MAG: hypothetical protein SCH71_09885 [Desulfobulbaceae bacterium]|nr:hypothetical protein [Desulfobulbaceae bacterium]